VEPLVQQVYLFVCHSWHVAGQVVPVRHLAQAAVALAVLEE
jgi:hypothetical protein